MHLTIARNKLRKDRIKKQKDYQKIYKQQSEEFQENINQERIEQYVQKIEDKMKKNEHQLEDDLQTIRVTKNNKYLEEYKEKLKKWDYQERQEINQYPIGGWFIGLVFIITGSILISFFLEQVDMQIQNGGNLFWEFVLSLFFIILGLCFLWICKQEKLIIDMKRRVIDIFRINFFRLKNKQQIEIDQIRNLHINKKGHSGLYNNTIHYVVRIQIHNQKAVEVLESSSTFQIQKKFILIQNYLQFDQENLNHIVINDESTQKYLQGLNQI